MPYHGREEDRNGYDFRRKHGFGDQAGLVQHGRCGARKGFAEQQPGEHTRKQKQGVMSSGLCSSGGHIEDVTENEPVTEKNYQGMDETPDPAHCGANVALLKIALNHLKNKG